MSDIIDSQPSDEQEAENAAFLWMRETCLALSKAAAQLEWDKVDWCYERYRRARERMKAATEALKKERR